MTCVKGHSSACAVHLVKLAEHCVTKYGKNALRSTPGRSVFLWPLPQFLTSGYVLEFKPFASPDNGLQPESQIMPSLFMAAFGQDIYHNN